MILAKILLCLINLKAFLCLYEDQIHKWDWRQRFVGIDIDYCLRSIKESTDYIYCASGESNILSAINKNGEIVWRNVQERQAQLAAMSLSSENTLITVSQAKTPNSTMFYLRKWSRDNFGSLINEQIDIIHGDHDCIFHINPTMSIIKVLCSELESALITKEYNLKRIDRDAKQWSQLAKIPADTKLSKDCIVVGAQAIVCLHKDSISFNVIAKNQWAHYPLPNAHSSKMKLTLDRIINENGDDCDLFGVISSDPEEYYIYKISDKIELKHKLSKVMKVSLLSTPESSGGVRFFAVSFNKDELQLTSFDILNNKQGSLVITIKDKWLSHSPSVHQFFPLKFQKKLAFVISFQDQRLAFYEADSGLIWQREEGLSSIISSQFISLPYFSSHPTDYDYWKQADFLLITPFISRIKAQVASLQKNMQLLYDKIFFGHKVSDTNDSNDKLTSDQFGLHKLIFVLTKRGKILVLDNLKKGLLVQSHFDARLRQDIMAEEKKFNEIDLIRGRKCDRIPHVFVHQQRSELFNPLITVVTRSGYILSFNPLTGNVEDKVDLKTPIKQTLMLKHPDENGVKGILLMDDKDQIQFYPRSSREIFIKNKHSYYILSGHQAGGELAGYSFHHLIKDSHLDRKDSAKKVWTFSLPRLENSCLSIKWREEEEHVHSQGKVLADRSVLYKYLNPNLVALMQKGEELIEEDGGKTNVINFYLLDAITGAIYYSVTHRKASDPVHFLHSENFIIYSFYNEKQRRIEISSLELFEGKESPPPPPPVRAAPKIIEHISFIFPTGIRSMKETRTIRGITNKHILIALTSGGILSLPRVFLDPRRASLSSLSSKYASSASAAAAAMEEGGVYLPPYIPELPIPSEGIVNYNQSLLEVDQINVGVSSLESTCLLFITGLDIYHTRTSPSKTFDILKDDFDHLLIIIVLAALVIFSILSKYLACRKSLNASWK